MADITCLTHPEYDYMADSWYKWRLTYEGGQEYIEQYLKKFSNREDTDDFNTRKEVTYCPAHAKSELNEIKNGIFQRMVDISRSGGSLSYQRKIKGEDGGVDKECSSMNSFIGTKVLPELLSMGKVGIYVDMPDNTGKTLADNRNKSPYIYMYQTEHIRAWKYEFVDNYKILTHLVLRDLIEISDEVTGVTSDTEFNYRLYTLNYPKGISVTKYDNNGKQIGEPITLNLPLIPFVTLKLSQSLLTDIDNYQVALLNMESGDVNYSLKSNYPFYTEQYNPAAISAYIKPVYQTDTITDTTTGASKNPEIKAGPSQGRKYPIGAERPDFIHPSPEPLRVSMEKQDKIKEDIKKLINLNLTNVGNGEGLEAGLSYIGLVLEQGERQVANIWSIYEKSQAATISYPSKYSLRSDEERISEGKELSELIKIVPSMDFKKEILKQIVNVTIGPKISYNKLKEIYSQIDQAEVIIQDVETLEKHIDLGLLTAQTASRAIGYPEDEFELAKQEHAERAARIVIAQTKASELKNPEARGVKDLEKDTNTATKEKKDSLDTTMDENPEDKTRGEGQ